MFETLTSAETAGHVKNVSLWSGLDGAMMLWGSTCRFGPSCSDLCLLSCKVRYRGIVWTLPPLRGPSASGTFYLLLVIYE